MILALILMIIALSCKLIAAKLKQPKPEKETIIIEHHRTFEKEVRVMEADFKEVNDKAIVKK